MASPDSRRTHPAHARIWLRTPPWTPHPPRSMGSIAVVVAASALLTSAGVAVHPVGAAPLAPGSSTTQPSDRPALPPLGVPGGGANSPTDSVTAPGPSHVPAPAGPAVGSLAADGIPTIALDAYRRAAAEADSRYPACGIGWPLLAAIGRVESDHGRFAGSQLYADGTSAPPIIGIPLDGHGTALITDTDGGRLDGDTVYDRAVGPMQFIPSTWATWGIDANHDGAASPFNIYDAATAAANYLCAAGGNLRTGSGQVRAILSYNHSDAYLAMVLALEKAYASGVSGMTIPVIGTNPRPAPGAGPTLPPVNPGPPLNGTTSTRGPTGSPSPTAQAASPNQTTQPPTTAASGTSQTSATASSATASSTPTCATPSPSPSTTSASTPTTTPSSSPTPTPTPTSSTSGSPSDTTSTTPTPSTTATC
jgi:Transglycosylase SLT domain